MARKYQREVAVNSVLRYPQLLFPGSIDLLSMDWYLSIYISPRQCFLSLSSGIFLLLVFWMFPLSVLAGLSLVLLSTTICFQVIYDILFKCLFPIYCSREHNCQVCLPSNVNEIGRYSLYSGFGREKQKRDLGKGRIHYHPQISHRTDTTRDRHTKQNYHSTITEIPQTCIR